MVVVCRYILMNCTTVGVGGAGTVVDTNGHLVGGVGNGGMSVLTYELHNCRCRWCWCCG